MARESRCSGVFGPWCRRWPLGELCCRLCRMLSAIRATRIGAVTDVIVEAAAMNRILDSSTAGCPSLALPILGNVVDGERDADRQSPCAAVNPTNPIWYIWNIIDRSTDLVYGSLQLQHAVTPSTPALTAQNARFAVRYLLSSSLQPAAIESSMMESKITPFTRSSLRKT